MRKFLAALGLTFGVVGLVAAMIGVFLFMEEPASEMPAESSSLPAPEGEEVTKLPELAVFSQAETPADVLEALDYETTQNPDTVGWLEVPGTEINNSVLQSHNNLEYLDRNERGQYDVYGCYFVDYACSVGGREDFSPNTVIYGHSDLQDNAQGKRFSQLYHFTDPEFARNTPVIRFSTLDNFLDWEVFAVFYTDVEFDYIRAYPQEGVEGLAAAAMEKSLYDYGVEVGPEDKILTLSTCTIAFGTEDTSHRFVVMARLLPEGQEPPETAGITPRDPDAQAPEEELPEEPAA